jgi:hypothetical protein
MESILAAQKVLKSYGFSKTAQFALKEIFHIVFHRVLRGSFSQAGEDLWIDRYFTNTKKGFYVDVGCHEPKRLNNTYRLYLRGWQGVVVDAYPGYAKAYVKVRPRDVFVHTGIGLKRQARAPFYVHSASALSTFCARQSALYCEQGHPCIETIEIPVITLTDLCDRYVREKPIDLLCLDIEGYDMPALQSLDWRRYRPRLLCIEIYPSGDGSCAPESSLEVKAIDGYLQSVGYRRVVVIGTNAMYEDGRA